MATAAGAAVLIYYVFNRRLSSQVETDDDDSDRSGNLSKMRSARKRLSRRPAQAPATWLESLNTLSDTLRFTYSETLAKWPIGDLAFGINYLMRRQVSNSLKFGVSFCKFHFFGGNASESFVIYMSGSWFWLTCRVIYKLRVYMLVVIVCSSKGLELLRSCIIT